MNKKKYLKEKLRNKEIYYTASGTIFKRIALQLYRSNSLFFIRSGKKIRRKKGFQWEKYSLDISDLALMTWEEFVEYNIKNNTKYKEIILSILEKKDLDNTNIKNSSQNNKIKNDKKRIIVYKDGEEFITYDSIHPIISTLGFEKESVLENLNDGSIKEKGYSFVYDN